MALFGGWAIAVDSAWMAVIIAPGTGVDGYVTVLLSQVAHPSPTPDQVVRVMPWLLCLRASYVSFFTCWLSAHKLHHILKS